MSTYVDEVPNNFDDVEETSNQSVRVYIPAAPRDPITSILPIGSIIKDKQDNEIGIVTGHGPEIDANGDFLPYDKVLIEVVPLDNMDIDGHDTTINDYLLKAKTDAIAADARVNW